MPIEDSAQRIEYIRGMAKLARTATDSASMGNAFDNMCADLAVIGNAAVRREAQAYLERAISQSLYLLERDAKNYSGFLSKALLSLAAYLEEHDRP